ncbi:MAG: NAD(P)/FAD-dependent oxidoreductase [Chitinophagaceae bacterium]|nr:NAD(P)/FAD-dependent oxidoreductase [Chitinophagaceae bacterium]
MNQETDFDVIIIGGSYSGLAAAMALGRALRTVLIIDDGKPCNRQTPYSHNFLTQDGVPPMEIAEQAIAQLKAYHTVQFFKGWAEHAIKTHRGFEIRVTGNYTFVAKKVIFATGIKDDFPGIKGFSECWGISVLHCPYCHGYEVRDQKTGILIIEEYNFDFCKLISNWTKDLTVFTNGLPQLTTEQAELLNSHSINIIEKPVEMFRHQNGHIESVVFKDGTESPLEALYAPVQFKQHCPIPELIGCELADDGYIKVDLLQQTTVEGVFACGDNTSRMRTVANAVGMGTTAGMVASKKLILEEF